MKSLEKAFEGLASAGERLYGWRRKFATVAAGVLAIGLGYHVVFGHNGLTAFQKKKQDAQSLDRDLKALTTENQRLASHIEHLQSDPSAIEHQAREALHYTRPGEVIYTLPVSPAGSSQTSHKN